jgi:hypothetical protein
VNTEAVRLNRAGVLAPKDHRAVMYGRAPQGLSWSSKMLKSILSSYAALGYLIHQDKPVLKADGHPVQLAEPLWDEAMRTALIAKLAAKRPRDTQDKQTRAPRGVRLLSGRVFCPTCKTRLYVGSTGPKGNRRILYHCTGRVLGLPNSQGCKPAPSMEAAKLERIVAEKFLAKWGDKRLLRREFDPGTGYAARIAELERDRARLESDRAAGIYDRPADEVRFYENHKRMSAEIDALSALPDRPASMRWLPTGQRLADQWNGARDDAERREILAAYRVRVVLYPTGGTRTDRVLVHDLDEDAESDIGRTIAEREAVDDDAAWAIAAQDGPATLPTPRRSATGKPNTRVKR